MANNKLSSGSGSSALRQLNPMHKNKKAAIFFLKKEKRKNVLGCLISVTNIVR